MNERIRELVRQAGLDDADFPIEDWDNVPLARYTELIVRECLACSTWVGSVLECCGPIHTAHAINQRIKEQFGVEE